MVWSKRKNLNRVRVSFSSRRGQEWMLGGQQPGPKKVFALRGLLPAV